MKPFSRLNTVLAAIFIVFGMQTELDAQADLSIEFEKFTLNNGLEVIFHKDYSDPVVAVALTFHVGSAREKEGKTGFAHLFEHLLFLESENLGRGGLDQMSARIGGSGANGSTSRDRTNYFQTVPNDALEKMIWAEADKLGFFINTVSEAVLEKEKQVVKNEKRQGVDNAPYGHTSYVIDKNMYPAGHPYSWQVIGSLDDLQAATLDDVIEFYNTWYVPNNATLVIAGNFDSAQARAWIHKYFDEIPRGEEIVPLSVWPAEVREIKRLYHEDNFARLPELRLTWPGVELYHEDSYPLQVLSQLMAGSRSAPMYQVIVEEKEIAPGVGMFSSNSEIAGEITVRVRAYPGQNLNDALKAIEESFARYEADGFAERDLERVKAGIETRFYNGLSSVLGKAFQLAQYNIFAGDPGYINEDIRKTLAVTLDDVQRVYEKYLKGKPYVATSFVPRGQLALVLEGSVEAEVTIEPIVEGGEGEAFDVPEEIDYVRTPSSFDRTVEPPYGEAPKISVPEVWQTSLSNGLRVFGTENKELPLVQFNIRIDGGQKLDSPEKPGVASLLANVMNRGTARKTAAELEEAISLLGASIFVSAGRESFTISGNTLARNFKATMALVEEILLEPRWDEREFELARQTVASQLAQMQSNPNSIAQNEFNKLVYGEGHIFSYSVFGTPESVAAITLDDLKAYYNRNLAPNIATMHVAGYVDASQVRGAIAGIGEKWIQKQVSMPTFETPARPTSSKIYFYDVPNASQSVLRIGYLAMAETDEDFFPATVMNYILGGGSFASRLTQELREGKGYTYGIGPRFDGSRLPGYFTINTGVRSNITFEALELIRDIMAAYPDTFTEADLENTKSFLLKSNARAFETLSAKLNVLETISTYNWSPDFIRQQEDIVRSMSLDRISELARTYINPNAMIYLVVGDARTQMSRLSDLGFGDPVLLNP